MSRNYQRQLALLDIPAGNLNAFKKEGGKIRLYGMGDSPSTPEKTTQVQDLPDWAKGYAKDTLAKTAALTDINQNPYKAYGGERIAGFTPLQQQTFQTASGMQPSSQLGMATGLAGAAGLGALGTGYEAGRFSGGQFGNRQAAQYMSPYIEQAMQPQLREAERASQIQGAQQRAQAVGAGAFGGSRQAIMEAERERNLGMQQGDIRAKGYQTAYEQAANQYNQDMARRMQAQQLGEQSRQFGAGLGLQGLQTALQGAGQLGQLGQTEYGQKMGITELQSKLGAQQQQQAQRPLDVAYQDFINQQNYPYKQLGFMSDMIRGLPLGQQSTSQVYQGSGNTMGQLAGLGMGAYGLSKMMAADGGLMTSYADGGVTSQQNVESILSKLSDLQLQQAKEAALNRRDAEQAQMIDAEIAHRASLRAQEPVEIGGIAPAITNEFADGMEQAMASGGIVAFADGDVVSEKKTSRFSESALGRLFNAISPPDAQQQEAERLRKYNEFISASQAQPGFFESVSPEELAKSEKRVQEAATALTAKKSDQTKSTESTKPSRVASPQMSKEQMADIDARNAAIMSGSQVTKDGKVLPEKTAPARGLSEIAPKPSKAEIKSAVAQFADQNKLDSSQKEDLMTTTLKIREELGKQNQPILDKLTAMLESQKPDEQAMKDRGFAQALAEYGFGVAARASRPGARALESFAAEAPTLSKVAAKTDELINARKDNYAKLQMDQAKYEVALAKSDMQTAATLAGQIRQGQQQDKMLQFHIAKAQDDLALEKQKLAQQGAYQQASLSKYETVGGLTRDIMQNEGLPYDKALEKAARMLKPAGYAADVRAATAQNANLDKALKDIDAKQKYQFLAMMSPTNPKYAPLKAEYEAERRAAYARYGGAEETSGSPPPSLAQKGFKLLGTE